MQAFLAYINNVQNKISIYNKKEVLSLVLTTLPFSALLKGVLTSFILTFIVFTVYAILLTYTSLQENNVNVVMLVSTAISCILCGFITGRKASSKGILWGTLSGFIYISIMLLISISTVGQFSISPKMLISIGLALCCGALGGVIGINTNK